MQLFFSALLSRAFLFLLSYELLYNSPENYITIFTFHFSFCIINICFSSMYDFIEEYYKHNIVI